MIITITSINDCMISGKYPGKEIKGVKEDGSETTKTFFANQTELIEQLNTFGIGDKCDVRMVKKVARNGKEFWNIGSLVRPSGNVTATATDFTQVPGIKTEKFQSNDKMSKEDWAEKDRVTSIRIAKSVAVKAVIENADSPLSINTMIDQADQLLPWLLDTREPGADIEWGETEDPLDPPAF